MPYLERDGVKLYYEETGTGEPAMLLVHGWTCNHTHWAAQVAHFSKRHRVVTVDLRGHGLSDAPQQEYTTEGFADDVAWVIQQLGLDRPIVCGHSMGGFVTAMLGKNHPESLRARIIVDSPVVTSPEFKRRAVPLIERWKQPDYLPEVEEFIDSGMFTELDDPARRAEITAQMLRTPQHVLTSAMWHNAHTDHEATTAANTGPLLAIYAGLFPVNLAEVRALVPGAQVGQTVGSGHFNMVEVPEQVNAMIDRFLATCVK
jgi:pimeloyl-ACP methyl ester carboxylesterase